MPDWQNITYPAPLRAGDLIGVTAPSDGVADKLHPRLDLCVGHLKALGFRVIEGKCLRSSDKEVSGSRQARVEDLMGLWDMAEVKAILPPWGGEILLHLLPLVDFERLARGRPKWILGYSDTSTLLFATTLRTGIATAHGTTLMEMVPNQTGTLSQKWQDVLSVESPGGITLHSSAQFQSNGANWFDQPSATFNLTDETRWCCMQNGSPVKAIELEGRIIGGCLETLCSLVGTPYGDLDDFKQRCAKDGVLLYLENAGSSPASVCRMLWHMKLAGWFDGINGLLLGRSGGKDTKRFTYVDALHDALDDLTLPVIYDVDIGHRPPQMTIVNGSLAAVRYSDSKGTVTMVFD
ncbi:MAG TPA: S66 peptidase family protein [Phycisphaerae bacterium]|nr:S66 peptidase family protein [Phycisphaerae bacterium]